jgi:hypothetical protein
MGGTSESAVQYRERNRTLLIRGRGVGFSPGQSGAAGACLKPRALVRVARHATASWLTCDESAARSPAVAISKPTDPPAISQWARLILPPRR